MVHLFRLQVLQFKLDSSGGQVTDVIEAYLNTGTEMSSAAVAAVYKGKLLIGSLASELIICDLNCNY